MPDREGLAWRITSLFSAGQLDLSDRPGAPAPGWASMPEVAMADRLRSGGATDAAVRLYITFTAALDRARDASLLWNRSARLFSEVRWPFSPEESASRPMVALQDVLREYGVSQRHGPDSLGWRTIAQSLVNPASARHVWTAVYEGRGDAQVLISELQSYQGDRPRFPFLRGPKVGPMWVRMLAYPGNAPITSLEKLPVAVDVQVRKLTEYLGVTNTYGQDLERVRDRIQAKWAEDVQTSGAEGPESLAGTPSALDPALWFYAKWGCSWCERVNMRVPISDICSLCQFDRLRR